MDESDTGKPVFLLFMFQNKIIAHRGDFSVAPENTMQAIQASYDHGADGIEIDIRQTKDHQIIVFHDETVQRLAPKEHQKINQKKISECTLEEIRKIEIPFRGNILGPFPKGGYTNEDWYYQPEYRSGKGIGYAHILEFEDLLQWIMKQRKDFFMEVECKELGLIKPVMKLLEHYHAYDRCILFSGEREIIDEIQAYFKEHPKPESLRLGANIRVLNEETMVYIADKDLYEVGLNAWKFSEEDVWKLIEKGIHVFSNLGDQYAWWDTLKNLPVEAFKTNCMNEYVKYMKKK